MKKTLVILAAGMGSRYGGLKQVDTLGSNGESIIDFTIYDAIKSGFEKLVLIIRKEHEEIFEEHIVKKIRPFIEVTYAFQDINDIPDGNTVPEERKKPWGTTHAVLCAEKAINAPFAVINSDDYYGRQAFEVLGKYLASIDNDCTEHAMVGYVLGNTMSRSGSVSRGVCTVKDEKLESIVENLKIYYDEKDQIISEMPDGEKKLFTGKEWVSMNLFGFSPKAFEEFHVYWDNFIANNSKAPKAEALLPVAASDIIAHGKGIIKFFNSSETWFGMTYPEDRQLVKDEIAKKIKDGYYPEKLWER